MACGGWQAWRYGYSSGSSSQPSLSPSPGVFSSRSTASSCLRGMSLPLLRRLPSRWAMLALPLILTTLLILSPLPLGVHANSSGPCCLILLPWDVHLLLGSILCPPPTLSFAFLPGACSYAPCHSRTVALDAAVVASLVCLVSFLGHPFLRLTPASSSLSLCTPHVAVPPPSRNPCSGLPLLCRCAAARWVCCRAAAASCSWVWRQWGGCRCPLVSR